MLSVLGTLDLVLKTRELIEGRQFRDVIAMLEPIALDVLMAEPELGHFLAQAYSQIDSTRQCEALLDTLHRAGERAGNDRLFRRRLNLRAVAKLRAGCLAEAELLFETVARASIDATDDTFLATALMNLGVVADMRCAWKRAGSNYRQALVLFQRVGDRASMAGCYHNLGMLSRQCGSLGEAEQYLRRAIENYKSTGTAEERTATAIERAFVSAEQGDVAYGLGIAKNALRESQRLNNFRLAGEAQRALGLLYLYQWDSRAAYRYLSAALRVELRYPNPMLRAEVFETMSWLYRKCERYTLEAFYASAAAEIYSTMGMIERASRAIQSRGGVSTPASDGVLPKSFGLMS